MIKLSAIQSNHVVSIMCLFLKISWLQLYGFIETLRQWEGFILLITAPLMLIWLENNIMIGKVYLILS